MTWKGDTSTASISVQIEEEDNITDAQNFFLGPKKVSKVLMKEVLLFEPITDNNYPKVETVDLALTNIIGKMTSNWIINDRAKGSIIVQNLDHMLSYGISNSFQPYFGPPLTCQPNLPI